MPKSEPIRLYADFNNIFEGDLVDLMCVGSQDSMLPVAGSLVEGLRVLLSDGELQVEAVLVRDSHGRCAARPDWTTRRDL